MRAVAAVLLAACGSTAEPAAEPAGGGADRVDEREPARGVLALDPPAAAGAAAPNLAPGEPGEALLTWVEPDGSGQRVRLSRLSAMRWGKPATVASGARVLSNWADVPAAVRVADGSLLASWGESGGGHATELLVGRAAGGGGWKRLGRAHDDSTETEHSFASFVADGGGALAVWLDGRATARGEPMTLRSARVGAGGMAEPALLDRRVCDCCPTAAAMTDRGPVVVYRDRDDREVRDISIVRRVDGKWTEPAPVARDGWRIEGCPVNGPAIAARGRLVAVAWYTEAGGRPTVRAAFSRDAGATFAPAAEVDAPAGDRKPRGQVGIALDGAGDAIVSWVAGSGDAAQILVRRIAAGGGAGPERVVAATTVARSSGIPRALRVDDWLIVAWTDAGEKRLRASAVALREIGGPAAASPPPVAAESKPRAPDGERAPAAFRGQTADGRIVHFAQLRGKVALVNLWATWCAPCIAEFPHLRALHRQFSGRGVEFISISVDEADARAKVLSVWNKHGLPFTLWLDPDETAPIAFDTAQVPLTLVIDRRGIVRFRSRGAITATDADLVSALNSSLSAK